MDVKPFNQSTLICVLVKVQYTEELNDNAETTYILYLCPGVPPELTQPPPTGLSDGEIAAIVICSVLGGLAIGGLSYCIYRMKGSR